MLNQVTDIGPTLDEGHPHLSPLLRIEELEQQSIFGCCWSSNIYGTAPGL